ncbi:MAG TPA: NUDIX domain-containing protein [Blastocatellia bacterium]|nr:NUDIX domain-containing protein [Blastocatellia bacterium]
MAFLRDSDRGIEVYLSRRPAHFRYYPGAFVFPGGRADLDDDDLRTTAAREVREEIGIEIDLERLRLLRESFTSAHAGPVYHMFVFAYHVEGELPTRPNPDEVEEEIWISALEARDQLELPYQIYVAVETIARYDTVKTLISALESGGPAGFFG